MGAGGSLPTRSLTPRCERTHCRAGSGSCLAWQGGEMPQEEPPEKGKWAFFYTDRLRGIKLRLQRGLRKQGRC